MKLFTFRATLLMWLLFLGAMQRSNSQSINWASDGVSYFEANKKEIVKRVLPSNEKQTVVSAQMLKMPNGNSLSIRSFAWSADQQTVLIYTNTKKVWRIDTQGDYWVLNLKTNALQQVGASLPPSSLRFAKLSPDATKVAYVSGFNLYVEDLASKTITPLTTDGTRKLINGTFDWAYEEEFSCRDGFQWSPDGKRIAFWQIDARQIQDYMMINYTDSVYSRVIPVEYPTAGQDPSAARIGVIELGKQGVTWLAIEGDPKQHYLPRMEWNSATELFVQQLNRKQNVSKILNCNVVSNTVSVVSQEQDAAWIDVLSVWDDSYSITFRHSFMWMNKNQEFLWLSEKDGWRHVYRISKTGKETLVTKGDYDVMNVLYADEKKNVLYFHASPTNATQQYLYKTKLDGTGTPQRVTPADWEGTHSYEVSPNGQYALHNFQNTSVEEMTEFITFADHKPLKEAEGIMAKLAASTFPKSNVEFFKVKTAEGVEMDGLMVKPTSFDPAKKYPVVFFVYTEPWGANVKDVFGAGQNWLYRGNMAEDGYIYITIDNRGTPAPKGREWRKSIYRKIGRLNISDQAAAAQEVMKWSFVDSERIAVWGWSGGGSATLNLMFQYPDIYKTGISIAAVGNQLTYDNIYQERFMGLPQENKEDFVAGSPITHAKKLRGNLLYIHGTGDDNVHYNNAEMLINELVKYNKQFQFMAYPNRSHSISEGEGTYDHLATLYTNYLKQYCPPGGK